MNFFIVFITGIVVGIINGLLGGSSIISYPVLMAVGLNPLSAVVTNAVGVTPANFFALRAHKIPIKDLIRDNATLIGVSIIGTVAGALALLSQPISVLEKVIPFLLLAATATLFIPIPDHATGLSKRNEHLAIFGTGLYCGYFGPGQGLMVLATFARDARRSPRLINATKNIVVGVTAMVSNVMYMASGHVHWAFAAALGVGASIGGLFGGKWVGRLSVEVYRALIITVGICASVWLFIKYY
ncbi:MAG: sulfite exporter TauE/SafE family protein [Actinomycetes bacterium]